MVSSLVRILILVFVCVFLYASPGARKIVAGFFSIACESLPSEADVEDGTLLQRRLDKAIPSKK
ncbi:MAG: hypothetical protein ACON4T_04020 [Synechococcus sp.]